MSLAPLDDNGKFRYNIIVRLSVTDGYAFGRSGNDRNEADFALADKPADRLGIPFMGTAFLLFRGERYAFF